jgi:phosphoribosylformylglycinamidine synthase
MPWVRIGVVDAEADAVEFQDVATIGLTELREAWEGTLPALFN